jgi:predicted HTH transcriptional regulator
LDAANQQITLKVTGLNVENAEAVSISLERRETQVAIPDADGTLKLDGSPPLVEMFEAALELGEFKANDLAQQLNISAQNANNRLKRLVAVGALRKTRVTGVPKRREGSRSSPTTCRPRTPPS